MYGLLILPVSPYKISRLSPSCNFFHIKTPVTDYCIYMVTSVLYFVFQYIYPIVNTVLKSV